MPYSAVGKLSIVASADLGGLGAREGAPVEYIWTLPEATPLLLPWLMILGLLMLKSNRCGAAWLIWLPLIVVAVALETVVPPLLPSGSDFFLGAAMMSLAFGFAVVWLLADRLRRKHRLLTFLCVLPTLAVGSGLALLLRQVVGRQGVGSMDILTIGVFLGVIALASSITLMLCGLICRQRLRMPVLYVVCALLLVAAWELCVVIIVAMATAFGGGMSSQEVMRGLFLALRVGLAQFLLLLPFLILSSASAFYRERLKALLNIKPAAPPVLPPVEIKSETKTPL